MKYYFAPMEGLSTYIFRNAWRSCYRGADKYFTPFLANPRLSRREIDEILPEHNESLCLIPQILTNRAEDFLSIAAQLADYGYDTVNLNLGCPSGTVTARKRGAGFLSVPEALDAFLDEIFNRCPMHISIKTRIGVDDLEEWPALLSIFGKYPLDELIIHPRLSREQYSGIPHRDAFAAACESLTVPLCYNGEIHTPVDVQALQNNFPGLPAVMIGREILRRPYLLEQMEAVCTTAVSADNASPAGTSSEHSYVPSLDTLRAFHDAVYAGYQERMSGEMPVLYKMKDLWTYLCCSFSHPEKALKKIRKANHFPDYEKAVQDMFALPLADA